MVLPQHLITKVDYCIEHEQVIRFQCAYLSPLAEDKIGSVFLYIAKKLQIESIGDRIVFCLRELTANALRANLKRLYFAEIQHSPDPERNRLYEDDMAVFRGKVLQTDSPYLAKLQKSAYHIAVNFLVKNDIVDVEVSNNVALTIEEEKRIKKWLSPEVAHQSLDLPRSPLDHSEGGAGLGLPIVSLILRELVTEEKGFSVQIRGDETVARLWFYYPDLQDTAIEIAELLSED